MGVHYGVRNSGNGPFSPPYVTSNLILHLDAGDVSSYPGSGTTWFNLSTSGISGNGTLTNGPTYSSSNNGVLNFDGVNDFVSSSSIPTIEGTAAKSLEVWFNTTLNDSASIVQLGTQNSIGRDFSLSVVVENDTGGATNIPATFKEMGGLYGIFWGRDILVPLNYTSNIKNRWTQAVMTMTSSSQASIYINGILPNAILWDGSSWSQTLQTQPFTLSSINTLSSNPIYIGRAASFTPWGVGQLYYSGSIAIVRVYTKALSAAEVRQNYFSNRGRFGI